MRLACGYGTELAVSRADVAEDQDGGGASGPALASIGAVGVGADGFQAERCEGLLGVVKCPACRERATQPGGQFAVSGFIGVIVWHLSILQFQLK